MQRRDLLKAALAAPLIAALPMVAEAYAPEGPLPEVAIERVPVEFIFDSERLFLQAMQGISRHEYALSIPHRIEKLPNGGVVITISVRHDASLVGDDVHLMAPAMFVAMASKITNVVTGKELKNRYRYWPEYGPPSFVEREGIAEQAIRVASSDA